MKKILLFAILIFECKWQRVKVNHVQVSLDEITFMLVCHECDQENLDYFTKVHYNPLRDG